MITCTPQVEAGGIAFQVRVEQRFPLPRPSAVRKCFISNDALAMLAERRMVHAEPKDTFLAMQSLILGVARRMAQAGVHGDPLCLARASFH
jgi:hypothetical protein